MISSTITTSSTTTAASTSASAAATSTSVITSSTAPMGPGPRRLASTGASFLGRCRYSPGAEPVRARRTEESAARSPVRRCCTIKAAIPRASFVITYYTSYCLSRLYHARAVPDLRQVHTPGHARGRRVAASVTRAVVRSCSPYPSHPLGPSQTPLRTVQGASDGTTHPATRAVVAWLRLSRARSCATAHAVVSTRSASHGLR